MSMDPRALRDAFGAFLTGVTVVTTHDGAGQPIGFTANSFTSVSLDPPLLLVCLAKTSRNFETMTKASGFAVNILAEDQKDVSNTFARPVEDRFAAVDWKKGPHGAPVFAGVAAWFDCSLRQVIDAGDHVILLGQIEAFENQGRTGLGYARGGYFSPAATDKALLNAVDAPQVIGAVAERNGQLLLLDNLDGTLGLPKVEVVDGDGWNALQSHLTTLTGVDVTPGLIYSVYEDSKTKRQHVLYRVSIGAGDLASGHLHPVDALPIEQVGDAATRDVLKRFAAESNLGNFGVYVGNEQKGRVHAQAIRG